MPIDLRADHLRIVQDVLRRHLPAGVNVWVFGSRATWMTTDASDLDLALEGDTDIPTQDLLALETAFEDSDLPFTVDVVDLKQIGEQFRRIVADQRAPLPPDDTISAPPTSLDSTHARAWRSLRLGPACHKIGSGATPRGGKEVYLSTGSCALIRSQNVHNDGFRHEGLSYISEQHADDLAGVQVMPDDVLLNITGDSVARVCQVDPAALPARVNQHVAILRPDPGKLDPRFLRYALVSPRHRLRSCRGPEPAEHGMP